MNIYGREKEKEGRGGGKEGGRERRRKAKYVIVASRREPHT